MGLIIGRFRKKKETTMEVLEKLESKIKSIEEFGRDTEQTQKKFIGRFIIVSILIYCLLVFTIYFHYLPTSKKDLLTYVIPLVVLPLILMSIKKIVSWYFNRKIRKNREEVTELRNRKKKLLEEVMDKETYKVAKEILEKFSAEPVKRNMELTPLRPSQPGFSPAMSTQQGLRYRNAALNSAVAQNPTRFSLTMGPTSTPLPIRNQSVAPYMQTPSVILPRSILPRDRSVLDKMVDYLVGDGPSNRYALICKQCSSHNGMALREEFDYLSFKCCYCSTFNPARKQRPVAPKLEGTTPIVDLPSSESETEESSPSEQGDGNDKLAERIEDDVRVESAPSSDDEQEHIEPTLEPLNEEAPVEKPSED